VVDASEDVPTRDRTRASTSDDALQATAGHAAGDRIGRYLLTDRLGAGAMGEVWVATDPQLEREIAIKLVHPRLARDPDVSARMVREARAMAKLSHRGVIAIHDAGDADGQLFLAMELVRGRTLGAALRDRSANSLRDWRRSLATVLDAGRGLAAAHAAGVLHRDFKPDNVMVDVRGRVCVGDFGLATLGRAPQRPSRPGELAAITESTLTMTGALLGTPAYMSLEQLRGDVIDARADQFSFCVVAYEALYGERPFAIAAADAANIAVLADVLSSGAIRPPPARSHVPAQVRAILVRGLAADPTERWPDLETVIAALAAELHTEPRGWRGRAPAIAIAIGGVVIAAAIAWLLRGTGRSPPTATTSKATSLGPVPLRALLAASPTNRIAIGTDRIEVRDLTSGTPRSAPLTSTIQDWVQHIELQGEDVVRWSVRIHPGISRWDLARAGKPIDEPNPPAGAWLATLAEGDLVQFANVPALELVRDGRRLRAWPFDPTRLDQIAVSPSRRRFAYPSGDRFGLRILVEDTDDNLSWCSPRIADLTSFAWLDDHTLVYGSAATHSIEQVSLTPMGFSAPHTVHSLATGFAARIVATATSLVYIAIEPTTRVRLIGRAAAGVRDLDPSVSAELGWTADGAYVTWNRATHALERRSETAAPVSLPVQLDAEPVNATFADGVALVTERASGGRQLVAIELETGTVLWREPIGQTFAARCARDLVAPCFVAERTQDLAERYQILALDPRTGVAIGAALSTGPLEDFAVSADGDRILVAEGTNVLQELDRHGARITLTEVKDVKLIRSVAYAPDGGVVLAGTLSIGSYAVGRLDGDVFMASTVAGGEILSLVRPSPVSGELLTLGRTLTTELWQVARPDRE
jgi:hypothetical protein